MIEFDPPPHRDEPKGEVASPFDSPVTLPGNGAAGGAWYYPRTEGESNERNSAFGRNRRGYSGCRPSFCGAAGAPTSLSFGDAKISLGMTIQQAQDLLTEAKEAFPVYSRRTTAITNVDYRWKRRRRTKRGFGRTRCLCGIPNACRPKC